MLEKTSLPDAVLVVLVVMVAVGAALRAAAWWSRRSAAARIPSDQVIREARGVTLRVLLQGTRVFPGMSTRYANRTRGDLVLGREQFVLATNRGTLLDLGPGRGRGFNSARCTGPGRLILEGDDGQGRKGLYRVEITVEDAEGWAQALQPFALKPTRGAAGPRASARGRRSRSRIS